MAVYRMTKNGTVVRVLGLTYDLPSSVLDCSVEIVTHLLDHQDRALELEKCILSSPGIISDNQVKWINTLQAFDECLTLLLIDLCTDSTCPRNICDLFCSHLLP